ncbi:hypothetical protein G6F56_007194 [Rhizopus delemar]|nr:hypothetical protein G6F56_007194 [Rhizopus delemar]
MEREISILKKCRHPNVVQLLEVMDNPESKKMYIVLEYTCGEIEWRQDEKPVLSIEESRRIFRDIVNGLDYLHCQGIIHRDIKPANVLLSENRVAKISDFGVSYYNPLLAKDSRIEPTQDLILRMEKELAETAGTPAFFAPELCYAGEGKRSRISKAIDVWALGVTLYCLLFGQCPFTASSEFELFEIIPYQPLTFPFAIEDDLQDLLKSLLEKLPEKRITLDKVKSHPWLLDWNHPSMMNRLRQSIRKLSFSCRKSKKATYTPPPTSYSTSLLPSLVNAHHRSHFKSDSFLPNIDSHDLEAYYSKTDSFCIK